MTWCDTKDGKKIKFPIVIKPINEGSSIGVYICKNKKQFSRNKDEKFELREYGVGAQILRNIGLKNIILLTNNEKKVVGLDGFGLKIINQESF